MRKDKPEFPYDDMDDDISTAFRNLKTSRGLEQYLIQKARILKKIKNNGSANYLYHYTSLKAVAGIWNSKSWYIGSPLNMNDGLELRNADDLTWGSICFASFMLEPQESIAMWSMYAQPWSDGIMIKIPVVSLKNWIRKTPEIYEAKKDSGVICKTHDITDKVHLSFHAVCYTNADFCNEIKDIELTCGQQKNTVFKDDISSPRLVGYIKNSA